MSIARALAAFDAAMMKSTVEKTLPTTQGFTHSFHRFPSRDFSVVELTEIIVGIPLLFAASTVSQKLAYI
jgi:hypothetical protein